MLTKRDDLRSIQEHCARTIRRRNCLDAHQTIFEIIIGRVGAPRHACPRLCDSKQSIIASIWASVVVGIRRPDHKHQRAHTVDEQRHLVHVSILSLQYTRDHQLGCSSPRPFPWVSFFSLSPWFIPLFPNSHTKSYFRRRPYVILPLLGSQLFVSMFCCSESWIIPLFDSTPQQYIFAPIKYKL